MRGTRASASYARGLATYSSPAGMRGRSTAITVLAISDALPVPVTAPVAGKLLGSGSWLSMPPAAAALGAAAVGADAVLSDDVVGASAALRSTVLAGTAGDTMVSVAPP